MFALTKIEINNGSIPIVLIDNSGSTSSTMTLNNINKPILYQEIITMQQYFTQNKIENIYLLFWNSNVQIISNEPISVSTLAKIKIESTGGTDISTAINAIPSKWLSQEKNTNIFICTDGEICDNETTFKKTFESLIKKDISVFINTFENNKNNYLSEKCNSGTTLFKYIRNNKMTNFINNYMTYNEMYNDGFVHFSNYKAGPGYIPFKEYYFRNDEIFKFIEYIENIIKEIYTDNELIKVGHELSITLYNIIMDKSPQIKKHYINLFSNLFLNTVVYQQIRELFLNETVKHATGESSTFQEYLNERTHKFEQTQISLYENVKNSICNNPKAKFMTMPINVQLSSSKQVAVISTSSNLVAHNITLSDKIFIDGGIRIGKYIIPVLPKITTEINPDLQDEHYFQCIRQWIRAIYGKKFNLNPASDLIPYYFYADVLKIMLSDISSEIKDSYRNIAIIMLKTERYGTGKSEYEYLLSNYPAPINSNSENKMIYIFKKILKYLNIINISPYTWWYSFVKCLNLQKLTKTQYEYSKKDLESDGQTDESLFDFMKSKIEFTIELNSPNQNYDMYWEYECYYSLENIEKEGGYGVPLHILGKNVRCCPKMMLSIEAYDLLKEDKVIRCPICCKYLEPENFTLLESKDVELKKLQDITDSTLILENMILDDIYNINNIEKVPLESSLFEKEIEAEQIIELDSCVFDVNAFKIESPYIYIQDPIGCRTIEIKKQDKFNNLIKQRYSFLTDLDWNGICIAGGFCRSILLRQQLKDFDFFCYGPNHSSNFTRFSKELMDKIKSTNKNIKFLLLFKPQFNVFEIVCLNDPNNFIKNDMNLDNYKQYHFNNLQPYDTKLIIDTKKYTVKTNLFDSSLAFNNSINISELSNYIENNEFSNYFEDGDEKGVQMKYRFQFILTENDSIKNILSGFDLYPSRVAYDGKTTWLTSKSEMAYKYMINIINVYNASDLMSSRIKKYFAYGFSPVFANCEKYLKNKVLYLTNGLKFKILAILNNKLLVEHNSFFTEKMEKIIKLEQQSKERGVELYKSSLFCTLVALLRYVKINKIGYMFTDNSFFISINEDIKFTESVQQINFIKNINTRFNNQYWQREMDYCNQNKSTPISKKYNNNAILYSLNMNKEKNEEEKNEEKKKNKIINFVDDNDLNPFEFKYVNNYNSSALNYESIVRGQKDGETGFFRHHKSYFPCSLVTEERNYIEIPIFPEQKTCVNFERQINIYDDSLIDNQSLICGKYSKLYTCAASVREIAIMDVNNTSQIIASCKLNFIMGWNYYLDGELLNRQNFEIVKSKILESKKKRINCDNELVKLYFIDNSGNKNIRFVKIKDIVQKKDKIFTYIRYREPKSISSDVKKIEDCNDEELDKFYGKAQNINLSNSADFDKYYNKNSYIRVVYAPEKIIANKNKNTDGKRYLNYHFVCKSIEIININHIPNYDNITGDENNITKALTKSEKNKLILQIPNDTYTDKQIKIIVKYIKEGTLTNIDDFPTPTKSGVKVALSDVLT